METVLTILIVILVIAITLAPLKLYTISSSLENIKESLDKIEKKVH